MERSIRIGKDFNVRWTIRKRVDGERQPYELAGKELVLQYRTPYGLKEATEWKVVGNTIVWTFRGKEQKALGSYELILTENGGKDGMVTVDTCRAFNLVAHSCEETEGSGSDIVIEDVVLESEVAFAALRGPQGEQGPAGPSYDDTEIKGKLAELSAEIEEISENVNGAPSNYTIGYYLNADNTLTNDDNCGYTDYIPYTQGNDVLWRFANDFRPYYILFYREDKTFINGSDYQGKYYSDQNGRVVPAAGIKTYAPEAAFIRASFDLSYPEARVQVGDDVVWTPQEAQQGILEKAASLEDEVDEIKSELAEITGDAGMESHSSDKNRIGIFLEQTPKVTQYRLMVLCNNPPTESFSIYKARADHSDLVRIVATAYFGNWVIIDRDEEKPVLYIYKTEVADSTTDARQYEVRYQNMISLAQDVENLKNKDTNGVSWKGKTIVCFGDSLTEFKDFTNNKAYSDYIQDLTEAQVYNIGIGGSQLRQRKEPVDTPLNYNDAYAALDVVNMVKASCEQSFARQIAATDYLSANNLDRNDEIIALMQTINWNEVDIVTIMAGTNDWNNSSAWGSVSASNTDIGTTFGAINEIIRILLTTYPHLVIYWFTPTVRWLTDESGQRTDATFSDSYVNNGQTLREFSADIEKSVREHHIPVCDMYNTIGWNKYNFAQFFSDTDGVHPRIGKGTEQIAKKMIAFINANRTF